MLVLPWTGAVVSEADWHWAVGLWEGEGSVGGYVHKGGHSFQIRLETVDRDMVEEWQAIMDIGLSRPLTTKNVKHSNTYVVREGRRSVVAQWCEFVGPYVRTYRKRRQIAKTLEAHATIPTSRSRPHLRVEHYGREQLRQPPLCWKGLEEI